MVVMGVGGSSGIVEGKGSGGDEANSGDSKGGRPYNNQLKDPAEETTAAATVTATDTVTTAVKATEKDKNNAAANDGELRLVTKAASPRCTLRQRPLCCLGIQCLVSSRELWCGGSDGFALLFNYG